MSNRKKKTINTRSTINNNIIGVKKEELEVENKFRMISPSQSPYFKDLLDGRNVKSSLKLRGNESPRLEENEGRTRTNFTSQIIVQF